MSSSGKALSWTADIRLYVTCTLPKQQTIMTKTMEFIYNSKFLGRIEEEKCPMQVEVSITYCMPLELQNTLLVKVFPCLAGYEKRHLHLG